MKRPVFKEWFNSFDDSDRFLGAGEIVGESAFHANDEYIDELEKRVKKLEEGIVDLLQGQDFYMYNDECLDALEKALQRDTE